MRRIGTCCCGAPVAPGRLTMDWLFSYNIGNSSETYLWGSSDYARDARGWEVAMPRRRLTKFDVHNFLSRAGLGRTILQYPANSVIVALLARGDFVGEESITTDHPLRTTSAVAITACSALRIEKKAMLAALHK